MKKNNKKNYEFGKNQKKSLFTNNVGSRKAIKFSKEFFEPVEAHDSKFWEERAKRNEERAFNLYNKFAANATPEQVEQFWNSFKDQVGDMIEEAFREEGLI